MVPPTKQIGVQIFMKIDGLLKPSNEKSLPTSAFDASAWRPLSMALPISS